MNKRLIALMVLTVVIYSSFFAVSVFQGITEFWDSTEYLLKAKSIALGTSDSGWAPHREIVPAWLWVPFFWSGIGEIGIRVFMLLIGILNVYMAYLVGKEMFNENTGLFIGFLMSVFCLNHFYTTRLTMYVIAPTMFQAGVYFYWKYYKNKNWLDLLWCGIIAGVGMTIYYNTAFLVPIIGLFLLITDRKFYRNLDYYKVGIIVLLIMTPYFIYSYMTYGHPIPRLAAVQTAYAEEAGGGIGLWNVYLKMIPNFMTWPLYLMLILGLLVTYPLFFTFDQTLKGKETRYNPELFLYLWIIIPLILYTMSAMNQGPAGVGVVLEAYLMIIFPPMFIFISKAYFALVDYIKTYNSTISVMVMICLLIVFGYYQIQLSNTMFMGKLPAFRELKIAGELIKLNTQPGDVVASASVPQLTYYSEREVMGMAHDETEEHWNQRVLEKRPKFFLITVYEPHPEWAYTYAERNGLQPIGQYGPAQDQIAAVLFAYNYGVSNESI